MRKNLPSASGPLSTISADDGLSFSLFCALYSHSAHCLNQWEHALYWNFIIIKIKITAANLKVFPQWTTTHDPRPLVKHSKNIRNPIGDKIISFGAVSFWDVIQALRDIPKKGREGD